MFTITIMDEETEIATMNLDRAGSLIRVMDCLNGAMKEELSTRSTGVQGE